MPVEPPPDCQLCPRLVGFRRDNQAAYPEFHNAPVPSFGPIDAGVLVVGLAPGLKGANQTGRPFTGDGAGDMLYPALIKAGFAQGSYGRSADDGLRLVGCRITNAVRCVPPQNRVTGAEAATCRPFLIAEIEAMANLRVLLALGRVAHEAILRTFGLRLADYPFAHDAMHDLPNGLIMADSFHCSRYNVNTGRLTEPMFSAVLQSVRTLVDGVR
ncbi:uracil-DNA glycosylase [Minwuia sp.]|uniref:uracil-DNA glycosylase n=1 Tax=Minwuia sp. TaxID=2493630 RepID=UPI003A932779